MRDEMKEIYVDFIIEHYKHPMNFGEIENQISQPPMGTLIVVTL